jgi:hypothetical protein
MRPFRATIKSVPARGVRTAKPNSRIWIPSRPRHDGISVNQPRIIRRNVNYIGGSGHNINIWAFLLYDLLRRGLKSAGPAVYIQFAVGAAAE